METTMRCKILVIDDDPGFAGLVKLTLVHSRNDDVRIAIGGLEGIAMAEQDPPDLIILDIMMPAPHGFEVCRQLKAKPDLQNIPVLFQTAMSPARAYPEAQRLGAAGCMIEPYGPQELLTARDAVLRGETHYPG
jgi:DNA-binding response OmpR family regulator